MLKYRFYLREFDIRNSKERLGENICNRVAVILMDMLRRIMAKTKYRLQECMNLNGGQFHNVVFRIYLFGLYS